MQALLVEDSSGERLLLEALLKAHGHSVASFGRAEEAWQACQEQVFELVVLDWHLPAMDGLELCARIRTLPWGERAHVLLVTAHDEPETLRQVLTCGADDYLPKPVIPEVVDLRLSIAEHHLKHLELRLIAEQDLRRAREELERRVAERTAELVAAATDSHSEIEDRRPSEAELSLLRDASKDILERMSEGVVVSDSERRVVYVNRAAAEIFGYGRDEVVGMDWTAAVPADQLGKVASAWADRVEGRSSRYEVELLRRDGSRIPVLVSGLPILENNRLNQVLAVFTDLTEQRRAESEHRLLSAVVEQTTDGIVITDIDGKIQYVNQAFERMTGYGREEVSGRTPFFLTSGDSDPGLAPEIWQHLRSGRPWSGQLTNRRADGVPFEQDVIVFVVRAPDGSISNFVSIMRDVTEQRTLERQLWQAQKMEAIGQLAGGAAHDFNNLNQVVLATAEVLQRRLEDDHSGQQNVSVILRAARSAAELARGLLDFSRQQVLEPTRLDVNQLAEATMVMLKAVIPDTIAVEVLTAHDVDTVHADPRRLQQVLINLCVNARDAMPEGGRLVIQTANVDIDEEYVHDRPWAKKGPHVMLAVTDTGCGMDEATVARVFDPFFTTKDPGKGTGLGLASAYGIVKRHGGMIDVASAPGLGTTVSAYLPRAAAPGVAVATVVEESVPGSGERVLVVEDNPDLRDVTIECLENLGYEGLAAGDGAEALSLLEETNGDVDLVITDLSMPRMGGRELYEKSRELFPRLPFLFCTGYAPEWRQAAIDGDERTARIEKPFDLEALGRKLAHLLGKSGGT